MLTALFGTTKLSQFLLCKLAGAGSIRSEGPPAAFVKNLSKKTLDNLLDLCYTINVKRRLKKMNSYEFITGIYFGMAFVLFCIIITDFINGRKK